MAMLDAALEYVKSTDGRKEYQRAYDLTHKIEKRENAKAYRVKYPEKAKQQNKENYENHKSARLEYGRLYNLVHSEQRRKSARERYEKWRIEGITNLRERRRDSPESSREAALKWHNTHKIKARDLKARYKARKKAAFVEKVNPESIFLRDKGICQICHKRVRYDTFSLDHIIPLSKGGAHVSWNLQTAHLRCNISRGAGRLSAQCRLSL